MATRKIAGYTIVREHARGGMGTVYQALSPKGATVAIKAVRWPENVDPRGRWEAIERFQREARAARSLEHPNICQVLDFGADEDSLYIVMEFLDGQTVRDMIGFAGAVRADRAVEIVRGVGEALAHAHDQGIIHRDIKPENIMVLRGGQTKVTDFGLASVASEQTMTMPGTMLGTMSYMSPEQVRGEKVDARSDIFSLGATFYEMLTGVRAFQAGEPAGVMNQILTKDPPPIAGVPAHISETVARCLRKDPQERYQTTREMIAALGAGMPEGAAGAITAVPTPKLTSARARARRLPRALRRWPVLGAAAAVLAVGALAALRPWVGPGDQPTTAEVAAEAPATSADEAPARPEPPPSLDTPEDERKDVRRRANFHYPDDKEFTEAREWFEWFTVGPVDSGVTTVEDDALVLTGAPPHREGFVHGSLFLGATTVSEFVMEARITKLEGPDDWPFGFFHWSAPNDAYIFLVTGNGEVTILSMVDGRFTKLASGEAPTFYRGNAANKLQAVRRHGQLHIFVNDQYVLTAKDFGLGMMMLSPMIRSGVRAAFSDIRVDGISMRKLLHDVETHLDKLEPQEARDILDYMRLYAPNYIARWIDWELTSADRRTTVLVILPSGARLTRGGDDPANRLVETINAKGADRRFHWAMDVTESEVVPNEAYLECPLIAIGHPGWNASAEGLTEQLPQDPKYSTDEIRIYHDIEHGERRVALWGQNTKTDTDAVELFISSGLLDRFLAMVWGEG